jgi:hypothetical protein
MALEYIDCNISRDLSKIESQRALTLKIRHERSQIVIQHKVPIPSLRHSPGYSPRPKEQIRVVGSQHRPVDDAVEMACLCVQQEVHTR